MSDLHNPLFENEKEFLEQKKLEYERALRGDITQIKEKTTQAGKVALAGAGIAGSVWVITRVLGRKKNRPRRFDNESAPEASSLQRKKGPKDPNAPKSAAASAAVFQEALGFDGPVDKWAPVQHSAPQPPSAEAKPVAAALTPPKTPPVGPATHEPDPFEPQPTALVAKPAPAGKKGEAPKEKGAPTAKRSSESWLNSALVGSLGSLAKAAWQSDTTRGLLTQAVAAGLAALAGHSAVKSAVEDAQAPKNPDLAARADAAAAGAGAAGPFTPAQPSSSDALHQHPA